MATDRSMQAPVHVPFWRLQLRVSIDNKRTFGILRELQELFSTTFFISPVYKLMGYDNDVGKISV